MTMSPAMSEISDRLIEARKKAGYETAADAARALGVRPPTYYAHENGTSGLRQKVAEQYAKKFKTTAEWLLFGNADPAMVGAMPFENDVAGLPLLGIVQAGHWLEVADVPEGTSYPMVPVVRDPRYPHAKQYALQVVGDSIDQDYPDGSIVTCVDFADSGFALAEGMLLHVERHRAGGQLVENTLKWTERRKGAMYLVPHSSNPKHQPIPLLSLGSETEVVAKGFVVGGWAPLRSPPKTT